MQVDGQTPKPATLSTTAPTATVKTVTTTTLAPTVAATARCRQGRCNAGRPGEDTHPRQVPVPSIAGEAYRGDRACRQNCGRQAAPSLTKATAEKGGSAVVQIGAFSSTALADKGWTDVSSAMSGDMAGKSKRIEALEKNGATLYRTSVTGFSSRASADAFCAGLKAKGKICFVKQ